MRRYEAVATGGTFDIIHKGHRELLGRAFAISDAVVIGLTSDEMLAARAAKRPVHGYEERLANLEAYITESHPGSPYAIRKLEDDFGPAALTGAIQALVASAETAPRVSRLNEMRASRGLAPVDVVVVPMVAAYDGKRISTSRVRSGEIDTDGSAVTS